MPNWKLIAMVCRVTTSLWMCDRMSRNVKRLRASRQLAASLLHSQEAECKKFRHFLFQLCLYLRTKQLFLADCFSVECEAVWPDSGPSLVIRVSLGSPRFYPKSVLVEFVVDKVAL